MDSLLWKIRTIFLGGVMVSTLTGCGGGGATANPMVPMGSANTVSVTSNANAVSTDATTNVSFTINVPNAQPTVQTKGLSRSLQFISASTKSASIGVSNAGKAMPSTNVTCTQTCSATLQVPIGVDTFAISLYDAANASGNVLAKGNATATIVKGSVNTVSVVFDGVPASLAMNVAPATWSAGTAATSSVTVSAYDAGGNLIVGAQNYANVITLKNGDTTGATTLSTTNITSPSTTSTLRYNGARALTQDTVSATDGALSASASVAVSNLATPAPTATVIITTGGTPAPTAAGSLPQSIALKHILTYQEQLGSTQTRPFGSNYGGIAPYIDYALTDANAAPAIRAAGTKVGFYSTVHTLCNPQTFGECTPQANQAPAAVFATTCNGDQVTFSAPGSSLVQYQTDPASPELPTLLNSTIATALANNGSPVQYDFVFDDNANVPGDTLSYQRWYDAATGAITSPAPYCNYSNAEYIAGMRSLYANSNLPVISNAFNIPDSAPAASTAVQYLSAPNLWGGMLEYIYGSVNNGSARLKESGNIWQSEENTQLAVSNAHRLFIGYEHVGGTDAAGLSERLYIYASLMLAYDPASLVLAQDGTASASQVGVNPEEQLVATQPLVTQPATIAALQRSGGAYAREFAACYYQGALVGPCASVVNSSSSISVPLPVLSRSYTHTAVIAGAGVVPNVDNGSVTFTGSAPPATLAPQSAAILFP